MHPALRSIRYGDQLRDKAVIAAHLATVAGFPLGILARKIGRPLPDPRSHLGEYVVRSPAGIFACPPVPSPFFLGADHTYEPGLFEVIDRLDGGTFVDVGASVGFVTVRAAWRADWVVALEPHPIRFAYLKRNVQLNGLTNVTCLNCALGAQDATVALYDVDPTLGPHALDVSAYPGRGNRFEVPLRRLDDVVDGDVAVLKIDVEGAELGVLEGAPRIIGSRPLIVIESLTPESLSQLHGILHGYSVNEMDSNSFLASPE